MRCLPSRSVLALLACLVMTPAAAAPQTAAEISDCVRGNYPATSSQQTVSIKSFDRAGGSRTLEARVYWKRETNGLAKVMLQVQAPEDMRGSSYLLIEKESRDDTFAFLPAVNRVKRIQGAQMSSDLWGSDFSYEDIKQVQGVLASGRMERLKDEELTGRKVYVLSVVPNQAEESGYHRIVSWVDQTSCVPLKTEFFEERETPRKRLLADVAGIRQSGSRWEAQRYEMADLLSETRTELRVEKLVLDPKLPERLFNPSTFYLGH